MRLRRAVGFVFIVLSVLSVLFIVLRAERAAAALPPASELAADSPDLAGLISADVGRRSRPNFMRLYRSLWKSHGMVEKLTRAVDKAFDEQTEDLAWGTTGLQLAANRNNIIENIQEAAAFHFAADYDDFLKNLEERWSIALRDDILAFYTMNIAQSLAADTNSMSRAWLRQDHAGIVGQQGEVMMVRLKEAIRGKYPDLDLAGAGMALGLAGVVFRKKISQYIAKFFLRKGMKSAAAKAIGAAIPVVNVLMMLWGGYDLIAIAWDAKSEVRREIVELNQSLYANEVPQIYWDVMEPYVRDIFVASYVESRITIQRAKELAKDPVVIQLSEGLNEVEKQGFAERVAAIVREFGGTNCHPLLQDFGPMIRSASPANFSRLAEMLRGGNLKRLKAWFTLAGEAGYYDLHAAFPPEVWAQFPPNEESLAALQWMMQNLTPQARALACNLNMEELQWVMEELPPRYVSRLFGERHSVPAIQGEIARLSELADRESRIPWQGEWAYRWAKYGFYAFAAVGLYLLFLVLRLIQRLFSAVTPAAPVRRRARAPRQPEVVKAEIVPPAVPAALPSRGYSVRLRCDQTLAPQLRTILWDSSQRVLPDDDGRSWVLSVHLENLRDITPWVARNASHIEILEPRELRGPVRSRLEGTL